MRAGRVGLIAIVLVIGAVAVADATAVRDPVLVDGAPPGVNAVWEPVSDAPMRDRSDPFIAVAGNHVVLFGGWRHSNDGSRYRLDGAVYDLQSERWEPIPSAPLEPRGGPDIRLAGGRLLVFGGEAATADGAVFDSPTGRADGGVFDLTTGEWTVLDRGDDGWPPSARVAAFDGDEVVLFGDNWHLPGTSLAGVVIGLDGSRTQIPTTPIYRRDEYVTAWDGQRLLVWGGRASHAGAVWDRTTGEWTDMTPSPLSGPARTAAAPVDHGRALVLSRSHEHGELAEAAWYDLSRNTWTPYQLGLRSRPALLSPDDPWAAAVWREDGGPVTVIDGTGAAREIDPPWDGLMVDVDTIVSNLFTSGATVSVQLADDSWLAAPVPGDAKHYPAAARLPDGSTFVWDGDSGTGWRLIVDGAPRD